MTELEMAGRKSSQARTVQDRPTSAGHCHCCMGGTWNSGQKSHGFFSAGRISCHGQGRKRTDFPTGIPVRISVFPVFLWTR